MADKKGRVQQIIQRNLSEIIIYELKSQICAYASINEVKMTPDYSFCKVYVSHIKPEKTDELLNFLNNHAGKIRSLLASKISIYKTPELIFVKDELFEKGQAMDDLINHALHGKLYTLKDLDRDEKKAEKEKEKALKKAAPKKTSTVKKTTVKKTTAKKAVTKKGEED